VAEPFGMRFRRFPVGATLLAAAAALAGTLVPSTMAAPVDEIRQQELADALECPSPVEGRRSVLLVHGTGVTPAENWAWG
jgi:hypothetical protein